MDQRGSRWIRGDHGGSAWIGLDQAWFGSDQAWIRVNPPTLAPLPAIIKTPTQTSQRRGILNQ